MATSVSIPIFRNGVWLQYPIPPVLDPLWSQTDLLRAASFYATAVSQGISTNDAASLAECFVHREVYPTLQYPRAIDIKLQRIMGRVEKA